MGPDDENQNAASNRLPRNTQVFIAPLPGKRPCRLELSEAALAPTGTGGISRSSTCAAAHGRPRSPSRSSASTTCRSCARCTTAARPIESPSGNDEAPPLGKVRIYLRMTASCQCISESDSFVEWRARLINPIFDSWPMRRDAFNGSAQRSAQAMPQRWNDGLCSVAERMLGVTKQNLGGEASRSKGEDYAERLESLDPRFHSCLLRVHLRTGIESKHLSQNGGFEPRLHSIAAA